MPMTANELDMIGNFDDVNDVMGRRKLSIAASNGKLYLKCSGQLSCRSFHWNVFPGEGGNGCLSLSGCSRPIV